MRNPISSLLVASVLLACTNGSGVREQQDREVGQFDAIDVGGPFQVEVQVGPPTRVSVAGDDNVVPRVRSEIEGSTLHIELPGRVVTKLPLTVSIATPTLSGLDLSGASTATVTGLTGERFSVDVSGASRATLAGEVTELDIDVSGASELEAEPLTAARVEVDASGASKADVTAHQAVDAESSGASTVRVHGNPEEVSRDTSGASKIEVVR